MAPSPRFMTLGIMFTMQQYDIVTLNVLQCSTNYDENMDLDALHKTHAGTLNL